MSNQLKLNHVVARAVAFLGPDDDTVGGEAASEAEFETKESNK